MKDFIEKARAIYSDKYDYSKSVYVNGNTPILIICNKCKSELWECPKSHFNKRNYENKQSYNGCKYCAEESTISKAWFIKKSIEKHGDSYDYLLVNYIVKSQEKVTITHKKCGKSFLQTKNDHSRGKGCPYCFKNEKMTTESFIEASKEIYGEQYDYSLVDYKNNRTSVDLICNNCDAEFKDLPNNHLHSKTVNNVSRCPNCKDYCKNLTTEEFVEKAKSKFGDKYDYSEVEYKRSILPVVIKCNSCNVKFEQIPNSHLNNNYKNKGGCPSRCYNDVISHGEQIISKYFDDNSIKYIRQYTHPDCKYKKVLQFDFYVESLNLLIEYDGIQHFKPIKFFGGEEHFKNTVKRDKIKNLWAEENGYVLIRFRYDAFCIDILDNTIKEVSSLTAINRHSHIDKLII